MRRQHGPIVGRRKLGLLLRKLRDHNGLTLADVADEMGFKTPKLSRMEGGHVVPSKAELHLLVDVLNASSEQRNVLVQLAEQARRTGWYETYEAVLPPKFETYVGLEEDATRLLAYETHVLHGLLQTEDHARALLTANNPTFYSDDIEKLIELRMRRKHVLTRQPDPLALWAVLEESIIRRPVGGTDVHRQQLQQLLDTSSHLPHVEIQILPLNVGAHAGLDGAFSILEFDPEDPQVVYVEGRGGNLYLEKAQDLTRAKAAYSHIQGAACSTAESAKIIKQAMKETA